MRSEYLTFAKKGLNSSVLSEECMEISQLFGFETMPIKYTEYDQKYGALRSAGYKKTKLFEAFKQLSEKKCVFSKVIKIKFQHKDDETCNWPKRRILKNNYKKMSVTEHCVSETDFANLPDYQKVPIEEIY